MYPRHEDETGLAHHLIGLAARSPSTPLALVLVRSDTHELAHRAVILEGLLRDPENHYLAWQSSDAIAFVRRGDELDAVVWAEGLRGALRTHGVPVSAGIARPNPRLDGWPSLHAAARAALDKARMLGGRMVVTHSSLVAATRASAPWPVVIPQSA